MAANVDLSLSTKIKEVESRLQTKEEMCGNTLMMPFTPACSSQRKIMFAQHLNQHLNLIHGEVPLVCTGFEDEFAKYSSSYKVTDREYILIDKVSKFSKHPYMHYYAILQDVKTKELSVIERVSYVHTTEAFGYLMNNNGIDYYEKGNLIPEGTILEKSTSYDEYGGHADGINLLTAYMALDSTIEDSIIISEATRDKLTSPTIKTVGFIVNDNDILVNLYGKDGEYKIFPDIGEDVKDGIVCSIRREKKEESLYTQTAARLTDIMMSDNKKNVTGTVIDINVYCNDPDSLQQSYYNSQIRYYYNENIRVCREIVNIVESFGNVPLDIDLQKLYETSKRVLNGDQYIRDKPFSNIYIELTLYEENKFEVGDKLSNRYGGKGVVSRIIPTEEMPILDNGERVEMIYNSSTCVNRLNPSQLIETSVTHIGNRIVDFIKTNTLDVGHFIDIYERFVGIINPEMCKYVINTLENLDEEGINEFIGSIIVDKGIRVSVNPISDSLTIDHISKLYDEFPFAVQYETCVPLVDCTGKLRYSKTRRPIVCGRQYIYRLKQYAEEKFSVTSLSATNIKNENSRSKASKNYDNRFKDTPIQFGEMETGDLGHLGMEFVISNLMIHSASPKARRLTEALLTGDPFNIDIKLDSESKNRKAEIVATQLKTMGLRLEFRKIRKKVEHPFIVQQPIMKLYAENPIPEYCKRPFIIANPDEKFPLEYFERMYKKAQETKPRAFITKPFIKIYADKD